MYQKVADTPLTILHPIVVLWFEDFIIFRRVCRELDQSSCSSPWGQPAVFPAEWGFHEPDSTSHDFRESKRLFGYRQLYLLYICTVFQKEMALLINCLLTIAICFQIREDYQKCLFFSLFKYLYFL